MSNASIINASIDYITPTTISSSTLNVSTINVSNGSITGNVSLGNTTITNGSIAIHTADISTSLKIPNNVSCNASNDILSLHYLTTNTTGTGIRVPNYLDGLNTGTGFTIGYNHTAGFVNVCRALRVYDNILTDDNINAITNTATIGIGQNITTGGIKIGNTGQSGNISIDTTGDLIISCDLRSTWNTSDLLPSSTQLGSFYRQFTTISQTKTSTDNSRHPHDLFYPAAALPQSFVASF